MNTEEKKIYFALSPHINYYHSYRGDSKSKTGFGKDLEMMRAIVNELDKIEDMGLGTVPISWDYADTFFSIQLQKEYQHDVLDRVIERCKKGIDEVLIGSWGNVIQPILDTEEFLQQHEWFLENSMGIGVNQLFPGRIAPYARTQESMFTQGMIELYNQLGVKGICNYYSVYGFDVTRPFINPRLDWNQRYGVTKFNSTISDASCLMIPTYAFGDILDYCSIKKWFELIRSKQLSGEISGHALIFLNFDMDYENWIGMSLPKFLKWMPNSRGLMEFTEAVNQHDYIEFTNLIDIIPKLKIHGEVTLREDVADGMWNGYYNWAQKYNNTKYWTVGQQARWLKCISDTMTSNEIIKKSTSDVNNLLRNKDEAFETYIKNKILFASTTNFGMAMPFLHSDRRKTAISYGLKAFNSSKKAFEIALQEFTLKLTNEYNDFDTLLSILPITERGISEKEKIPICNYTLIRSTLPKSISNDICKNKKNLRILDANSKDILTSFSIYSEPFGTDSNLKIEALIPQSAFSRNQSKLATYYLEINDKDAQNLVKVEREIIATEKFLKNKFIYLVFNEKGKIISFRFNDVEFACPSFLESSISYGKTKKPKIYNSNEDQIIVQGSGDDGFSASISIISEFYIEKEHKVKTKKVLKLYSELPYLFVNVSMVLPEIKGETTNLGKSDGTTYSVDEQYNEKWQEIVPCEIRANILGLDQPLKIWKRNFLGIVDYFKLDMKEVDPKNANIDCLVANVSDGWMSLSNNKRGLLIGFNSLKAANFAFSPIKIKDKGFGDIDKGGQQVRINPFGTYFGKILHYWTKGNGHAQKIVAEITGTDESTAPTFSGKKISFDLILCPFIDEFPPTSVTNFADHFSFEPLVLIKQNDNDNLISNHLTCVNDAKILKDESDVEDVINMTYIEWVRKVNSSIEPEPSESSSSLPSISIINMLRILIDGIRGR